MVLTSQSRSSSRIHEIYFLDARTKWDVPITTILQEIHAMRRQNNERDMPDNYTVREEVNVIPRYDGENLPAQTFISSSLTAEAFRSV